MTISGVIYPNPAPAWAPQQKYFGPGWMTEPWTTGGLATLRARDPGPAVHVLARQPNVKSIHTAAITHKRAALLLEIHPQSRLHFNPRNVDHPSARCHDLASFTAGRLAQ